MNDDEKFKIESRSITVIVVTFSICFGAGISAYIVTQSGLIAWIVVAISYVVILLAISVVTRDRT